MTTVLEELRRLEEPTPEEFVDAVIRTHERIQSQLRALARNTDARDDGWPAWAAETIRSYSTSYGVNVDRGSRAGAGARALPGVCPSSAIKSQIAL